MAILLQGQRAGMRSPAFHENAMLRTESPVREEQLQPHHCHPSVFPPRSKISLAYFQRGTEVREQRATAKVSICICAPE